MVKIIWRHGTSIIIYNFAHPLYIYTYKINNIILQDSDKLYRFRYRRTPPLHPHPHPHPRTPNVNNYERILTPKRSHMNAREHTNYLASFTNVLENRKITYQDCLELSRTVRVRGRDDKTNTKDQPRSD